MQAETVDAPVLTSDRGPLAQRQDADHRAFRTIAGQAASGMIWTGVALSVGFALKVVLTRRMAPREMGIVLAAQSFVGLAAAIAALGIPDAVVRFLGLETTPGGAPKHTVHVAIRIVAVATVTATALALAALPGLGATMSADALRAAMIMTLALPVLALGEVLGAAYRGVNRLGTKILMLDILRPAVLVTGLLASPLVLARQAPYVAGLFAAAALVSLSAAWLFFRRDRRWRTGGTVTPVDLLRFGVPLAGSVLLAGPLINNLLPLMLSAWTDPAAVAFYTIALSVQALVYLPVGILEQAVIPTWTQMAARRRDGLAASYRRYTSLCFAGAASLGLVIMANDRVILTIVFGPSFEAASWALRAAIVATLCAALAGPNEGMLHALGHATSIFHARAIAAIAGIAAGVLLIPSYGLGGAIAGFMLDTVLLNTLYAITLYRKSGIHPLTERQATSVGLAGIGIVAALASRHPLTGSLAVSSLAALIVLTNRDLRSALRVLIIR